MKAMDRLQHQLQIVSTATLNTSPIFLFYSVDSAFLLLFLLLIPQCSLQSNKLIGQSDDLWQNYFHEEMLTSPDFMRSSISYSIYLFPIKASLIIHFEHFRICVLPRASKLQLAPMRPFKVFKLKDKLRTKRCHFQTFNPLLYDIIETFIVNNFLKLLLM